VEKKKHNDWSNWIGPTAMLTFLAGQQCKLLIHQSQLDMDIAYLINEMELYLLEESGVA
jgi:hypothetical protein